MHDLHASFILGYHGCDETVAEDVLERKPFKASENDYDWLGHGIYFWEANPKRGFQFAKDCYSRATSNIQKPAVVGAVIQLGKCLDLTTSHGTQFVKIGYAEYLKSAKKHDLPIPANSGGPDQHFRRLDCAAINTVHKIIDMANDVPFDTVRGIFVEGDPIFDGSKIYDMTHTQICVRNTNSIKGVFRVPDHSL